MKQSLKNSWRNTERLTLMQKSTASLTSAESANLQLQHAIRRQAAFFFSWSCMVFRYFFLQHVKQQLLRLTDIVYNMHSSLTEMSSPRTGLSLKALQDHLFKVLVYGLDSPYLWSSSWSAWCWSWTAWSSWHLCSLINHAHDTQNTVRCTVSLEGQHNI